MAEDRAALTRQVKEASDIVAVVGSYLALHTAGGSYKALCPFHQDTRPSLTIDPKWQNFKCWACGKHGDVFTFVMEMEKVDFMGAREVLARRANISLEGEAGPNPERLKMLDAMRWAETIYRECLHELPIAADARRYVSERKLEDECVRQFGLGFAPLSGDWLTNRARQDGQSWETLQEVGLLSERKDVGGFYDRFRDRVMFPIRDVRGQTVGFGGRILPASPYATRSPKYYNSSDTPLFNKSELIYGLDLARYAGSKEGFLAVVEGYTDVMMAHQCGVPQVVATMGTALNARHVNQLRRYAPKVVLVYDADAGGMTGVDRALEIFVSHDVELAVAVLPDGLDPCDLLSDEGGVEIFNTVLGSAVDALDFKMNRLLERDPNPSIEATRRIIDSVLGIMTGAPALKSQSSQVKQELIVTRLSHRLGLRQETVWARLGELARERKQKDIQAADRRTPEPSMESDPIEEPPERTTGPRFGGEKQLLNLLLAYPEFVALAVPVVSPEEIGHTGLRRMLGELYSIRASNRTPDMDILRERLHDRPDLFRAAETCREVGLHTTEAERNVERILKWFADQKSQTVERTLTAKLKGGALNHDEAAELLRKLQQRRTG